MVIRTAYSTGHVGTMDEVPSRKQAQYKWREEEPPIISILRSWSLRRFTFSCSQGTMRDGYDSLACDSYRDTSHMLAIIG